MRHLFYHGVEFYWHYDNENGDGWWSTLQQVADTIESGFIKTRKHVSEERFGREEKASLLDHVCLFRKNEEFDYHDESQLLQSAKSGWIDNGIVFVISDEIEAVHHKPNEERKEYGPSTNLVDEWRCFQDIPMSKVIGIALPVEAIKETLEELKSSHEILYQKFKEDLSRLNALCKQHGFKIFDSDQKDFTDEIDSSMTEKTVSEVDTSELK